MNIWWILSICLSRYCFSIILLKVCSFDIHVCCFSDICLFTTNVKLFVGLSLSVIIQINLSEYLSHEKQKPHAKTSEQKTLIWDQVIFQIFGGMSTRGSSFDFLQTQKTPSVLLQQCSSCSIFFFDKLEGWKGVFQQDPRKKYFGSTRGGSLWTAPTLCVFVYRGAMNISLHLSTSYTWNSQYEWFHK